MKYIYAASFLHESNTFSQNISDINWFQKRCWKFGNEVIDRFQNVRTEFGGFIDAISQCDDMTLVPILAAEATPSGPVSDDAATHVQNSIISVLKDAPRVDAVLLSMHGAMVTETSQDGEGDLAEVIRSVIGPDIPIYTTLDLHANVTEKMARLIDVMIPYDLYPHTDKYERGYQTANLLVQHLRGEIVPYMITEKLPVLFPLISTNSEPMRDIYEKIITYEKEDGIINVSLTHGFINADIYESGACIQVITNKKRKRGLEIAKELGEFVWENRTRLLSEYKTPKEAAAEIILHPHERIVVGDGPDNPGGGSYADGTHMLRALLNASVPSALVALICDPDSVDICAAAGEGAVVNLSLGGKYAPELLGKPVECIAKVIRLTNGQYNNYGPMNPGLRMNLLGTALIDIGGIRVIVVKNPTQPYDFGLLDIHGIDPNKEHVIVVKSSVHFRAAYSAVADRIIQLSYPSICAQRPQDVSFIKCKRPIYPLDLNTTYR